MRKELKGKFENFQEVERKELFRISGGAEKTKDNIRFEQWNIVDSIINWLINK